ncbi:MAG: EamA family transporter [Deinococcus-Thermus bacterium]|jgi:drug/metabolite transporter (DMT)-like permease|nr:EamA family transporter [Deinococcota bacterium]
MTAVLSPSPEHPGALNWALVTALGAIWGAAFMGQALALEGFGPVSVAALRTAIGAVALFAIAAALGQGPGAVARAGGARGVATVCVLGVTTVAAPFGLLAWGLQHVPSAFAGVAMGAVPLLILPLVAIFSPEEGIGPRRLTGVALGFAGILLLVGPGALAGGSEMLLPGRLACLGAAACYAVSSVITRRAPPMPPVGFAAGTLVVGALVLLPFMILREGWPSAAPPGPTAALVLTALFPTGLAAAIRVRVITTAGSLFMSLTSYMVPVWSVIFGVTLMGETLEVALFAGLGLILAGIAIAQSRALLAHFRPR